MSAVLDQPELGQQPVNAEAAAAQLLIRQRWNCMAPSTRELLMKSGYYGARGNRLEPEDTPPYWIPETNIERLEGDLGMFARCLDAKLPTPKQADALIPAEALTEEVLSSCEDLLMVPQWHDPEFLRYGILALAAREEANALTFVVPKKSASVAGILLAGIGKTILVVLAPYGLASGLMAAMRQDLWSAVWGFYLLGIGVAAASSGRSKLVEPQKRAPRVQDDMAGHFGYAYDAWQRFRYSRHFGITGAACKVHLERMADEGVNVPPVAFDLCETLRLRLQSLAAER